MHIPQQYYSNCNRGYDYALITVKEDLSDYFCFSLGTGYDVNTSKFEDIPVYLTGIPGKINVLPYDYNEKSGNPNETSTLYTDEGNVIPSDESSGLFMRYNMDATEGQSGSPVYTITRSKIGSNKTYTETATVLSIFSGGLTDSGNAGPLITNYHLQFYKDNPNISYLFYKEAFL